MTVGRLAAFAGLLLLGALTGVTGTLVQAAWFPGGLLLALLAVAGLCYGGLRAAGVRAGALVPAVGWLLAVILLTPARPEGDFLFGAGVGSYIFLLGGTMVAVMCATLPHPPPPGVRPARLDK
ncbi:DUF6113 family protein [Streptomyces sp. NPDC001922]|uniref:DUF6113 family protein n=1 Tax=Streptomyces sp. NPDC001922 TaxID=3364624 RepID=UPI0036C06549